MELREYKSTDCEQIAQLFYNTVYSVNVKNYTEEQLNAWATGSVDLQEWNHSFLNHKTVVAVEDDEVVGFGDIDKTEFLVFQILSQLEYIILDDIVSGINHDRSCLFFLQPSEAIR